ncbi:hypothetical protein HBI12_163600 [Parastagonospora nodorum]|nr:hypothetical protein HBI12_163600 [Parastagonospora nodorum]
MKSPRQANEYRNAIIQYSERSYTKTIFQGFIYRFLQELLKQDETDLDKQFPDLDEHVLAHLSVFESGSDYVSSQYSYSQLQSLLDVPLPSKRSGQMLFLGGHLSGSWIASIGAKYGIGPEFFRRHIHLWRSRRGAVLYAVPTMPSVSSQVGITLRINTCGESTRSLGDISLSDRRQMLPDKFFHTPKVLTPAPGSSYIRGNAYLGDSTFSIEQDISITIESDGEGWTAILWSDVGSRDLSHSSDFHWFLSHLKACAKTGARWIILVPSALLSIDSELQHPLPSLAPGPINPNIITPNSLIQSASHLPREFHLLLDHAIAALDPLYALSPIFRFAAATSNQVLSTMTRRYEIISSALWDIDRAVTHLNQLITHKHLLSDHACRHEEVLRYLQSTHTVQWSRNLTHAQARVANQTKSAVEADFAFLAARFKETAEHHQNAIAMLTSATALAESRKQIQLATQVTKLTVLASVFLPLSFVTGLFGMNFVELEGLRIWVWGVVTVCVGVGTVAVYGWGRWREGVGTVWRRHLGDGGGIEMGGR